MDVRLLRAIVVLIACSLCGYVAFQPVEALEASKNVTSDGSKECLTARNVSGQCVHRQRCDFGTAAIDQTLYAIHGYVRMDSKQRIRKLIQICNRDKNEDKLNQVSNNIPNVILPNHNSNDESMPITQQLQECEIQKEPFIVNLNDVDIDITNCSVQFDDSRCSHIFSNISIPQAEATNKNPEPENVYTESSIPDSLKDNISDQIKVIHNVDENMIHDSQNMIVIDTNATAPINIGDSIEITLFPPRNLSKLNAQSSSSSLHTSNFENIQEQETNSILLSLTEDVDSIAVDKEIASNISKRPKRGRKRKVEDQSREIKKKRVNNNEKYVNESGKEVAARVFSGSTFNCTCPKKCTEKLSTEQRQAEFNKFWSSGCYEARCAILQGYVKEIPKKRCFSTDSKRAFTRQYNLCGVNVCKKTFLSTFQISQSRIDSALEKFKAQEPLQDKRGQKSAGLNKISQEKKTEMKEFIDKFPRYRSHYCRAETSANFLASHLNLQTIYNLYKEKHPNGVSMSRFRKCFMDDFNLKFKKPHKDTCVRCDSYKARVASATSNVLAQIEKEHEEHLKHAYELRDQMKANLKLAKEDPTVETLTFDLEKTHNLPELPTNIIYYKRQLNLYNLGIHTGSTGKGYFFVWLEHEAGRGTQEVGSCLKKFIANHLKPTATQLILWSDSCGGQNRSIKMTLMLQHILQMHSRLEKITIRFLQPGHTYLPNVSEFGDVECALKTHNRLYTDLDYINVMKNCRRKNKFVVTRVKKEDFFSIENILGQITNRKVDINKNKVSWLNTFEIGLDKKKPTELIMKSKLSEEPHIVDITKSVKGRKIRPNFDVELPILWPNGRQLSSAKIKDLKEMLKLVPSDSRIFYNFLKSAESRDFVDDTEGFGFDVDFEIEVE